MIRDALATDVPHILGMLRELAAYENLSHACVATEEGLHRHLFGPEKVVEALIAEDHSGAAPEVVGYALFFKSFSTFLALPGYYLEDLFVRPAFRGRGHGKALLQRLAQRAVEKGYGRVEWSVLTWNAPSIAFYKSLGAVPLEEWQMYRLTGEALHGFGAKRG